MPLPPNVTSLEQTVMPSALQEEIHDVAHNGQPLRKVFLKELKLEAQIGAYAHEKGRTQPVIVNLEADVKEPANPLSDDLRDIFCYDELTHGIKAIIAKGHIQLVETLAEQIAILCLAHPLCLSTQVSVEKPIAIAQASGAGVTITRHKDIPIPE